MNRSRSALTPDALVMIDTIARSGSFAAAARELGKVPSALTYSVRQLEEALDVLLFDRSSRQARLTAAGEELLAEGRRLLAQIEAVAHRVKRVASGWESQLAVAVDGVISRITVFELCEAFYALDAPAGPPTRLRLRSEVLAGTWEALTSGQADLAIGCAGEPTQHEGISALPLGEIEFVFAVAPHHPLATAPEPISDAELMRHRAIAVADSALRATPVTVNLLPGQQVLTVASVPAKIEAHLRGLGCGFIAEPMVREHVRAGQLVLRKVQRRRGLVRLAYAWRRALTDEGRPVPVGLALQWWLQQLESPTTRQALLERHAGLII
ncbi:MAG: LysR family transcriptional regulator [Ideonella sp.]|nr:LysR family transcriptional regulator [Ideonella sp.]